MTGKTGSSTSGNSEVGALYVHTSKENITTVFVSTNFRGRVWGDLGRLVGWYRQGVVKDLTDHNDLITALKVNDLVEIEFELIKTDNSGELFKPADLRLSTEGIVEKIEKKVGDKRSSGESLEESELRAYAKHIEHEITSGSNLGTTYESRFASKFEGLNSTLSKEDICNVMYLVAKKRYAKLKQPYPRCLYEGMYLLYREKRDRATSLKQVNKKTAEKLLEEAEKLAVRTRDLLNANVESGQELSEEEKLKNKEMYDFVVKQISERVEA